MLDIRRQFFYRKYDPLTNAILAYQNRIQNDGGTYINECLRTRLNNELPLSDKLSILTPNGRKVGKLYSFKGTDYDFVRASNAYRFNSVGDLASVANNEPRINFFQNECPQIVIEPQLTNIWTNNQLQTGFTFTPTTTTTYVQTIPNYFASGISGNELNFTGTGDDTSSDSQIRQVFTQIHNYCSMLISNPITNFFSLSFGIFRTVMNLTTLESISIDNTRLTSSIRKVKDNVWLVSIHYVELANNLRRVACGYVNSFNPVAPVLAQAGNTIIGVPSVFTSPTPLEVYPIPYPQTTSSTKLADVATVTPEVGTSEIIVNNNAPITTIPATFTIPNGFIDKIVMK